jgi:hypothetical protein
MQQEDTIVLVKHILSGNRKEIIPKVYSILYSIFNDTENEDKLNEHLSILYRLIFRSFDTHPTFAYRMLCGFLQFGQSRKGRKMKPMMDHLAIEAIDELFRLGGWSILKNCVTTLTYNVASFQNEPVFMHILTRIITQLDDDANTIDPQDSSDLCCYLPRERSFTWGWFSYYVAHTFYAGINACNEKIPSKAMRKYLMFYRKLITKLRRSIYTLDPVRYNDYYLKDEASDDSSNSSNSSNSMAQSIAIMDDTLISYFIDLNEPEYDWADALIKGGSAPRGVARQLCKPPTTPFNPSSDEINCDELLTELIIASIGGDLNSLAPDSLAPDSLASDSLASDSLASDSLAPDSLAPIEEMVIVPPVEEEKKADEQESSGWFSWFKWA